VNARSVLHIILNAIVICKVYHNYAKNTKGCMHGSG
jgi:hypothetical protein